MYSTDLLMMPGLQSGQHIHQSSTCETSETEY